jgi:hypothetical protein
MKTLDKYRNFLLQTGAYRADALETVFIARELVSVETAVYEKKYPEFKGRSLVPKKALPEGATFASYTEQDEYGSARIISSGADDLPRAEVSRAETLVQIYTIANSYAYTTMELKKAAFARMSLDAAKAMAARRIMEQKIDLLLQSGDAAYSMKGLLNQSGTNTYVVPNGVSGSPLWANKPSDEILTDLNGMANAASNATNGIEYPDKMVLPIAQYDLISQKPRSSTSDTTVKEFFLGNTPTIKEIIPWWPCKTAGAAGVTRAVTYRRDLEALWYYMPQEFQAMAPQLRNLEYIVPCTADFGGVHVRLPKSITYADGI